MRPDAVPWELLLPAAEDARVLWLGGDARLRERLAASRRVDVAAAPGTYAAAIRGPGGPPSPAALPRRFASAIGSATWLLWVSKRAGAGSRHPAREFTREGYETTRFLVHRRSFRREDAAWAEPLAGAGKLESVRRFLAGHAPFGLLDAAERARYEIAVLRPRDGATAAWLFEFLEALEDAAELSLSAACVGRIDATRNGAAILQLRSDAGGRYGAKMALETRVAEEMRHEMSVLRELRQRISGCEQLLQTLPSELAAGYCRDRFYRLDRWLPGRSAVELMYRPQAREAVVTAGIDWVTRLHAETLSGALGPHAVREQALQVLGAFGRRGDGDFAERIAGYLATRLEAHGCGTVFGHGDFWLGNILYEPDALGVRGVIDWNFGDASAPPLEDLLHLLCHRKSLVTVYDPGRHLAGLLTGSYPRRDRQRIAQYLATLGIEPGLTAALVILYWIRYLASRRETLSARRGWYHRSYARVRRVLAGRSDADLDALGRRCSGRSTA